MPNILLKRSDVPNLIPDISELSLGELAVNTADGKLYAKTSLQGRESIIGIGQSELEKIEENGNTGWALLGVDRSDKENIGSGAVDLTASINQSSGCRKVGAAGNYSFTAGYKTYAGGSYSTAIGEGTCATGISSFTEGRNTAASGNYSHAEGYEVVAQNDYMHAEGIYNVGTATDTIHETGIGTNGIDRKNAFEIYTDGKVVAPELTTTLINDTNTPDRVLVTREWVQANTGVSSFTSLTDTPADYSNAAGYAVKVNAAGDALEFVDDSTVDGGQF
jgi:hypothetical protein